MALFKSRGGLTNPIRSDACGGWKLKNAIPPDQGHVATESLIRQNVLKDIQDVLSGSYTSTGWVSNTFNQTQLLADQANFKTLQHVYNACMRNTGTVGLQDLEQVLHDIADLYPAQEANITTKDTKNTSEALSRAITYLVEAGIDSLFQVQPEQNPANVSVSLSS